MNECEGKVQSGMKAKAVCFKITRCGIHRLHRCGSSSYSSSSVNLCTCAAVYLHVLLCAGAVVASGRGGEGRKGGGGAVV